MEARSVPPTFDPGNNATRFSGKADVYARFRPGYPAELLRRLERERGFSPEAVVADVGSGTGKLTEVFLANGNRVFAVEPNSDMRAAAEGALSSDPRFSSIDGTAEATGLGPASVDVITAGQAFHWFDPERAGAEFRRILRPGGFVALIWNDHDTASSLFLREYDAFLQEHSRNGVRELGQRRPEAEVIRDFLPVDYRVTEVPNSQEFDLEGLWGRYRSASYSLTDDDPRQAAARERLGEIFRRHQVDGRVVFPLRTVMHHGSF